MFGRWFRKDTKNEARDTRENWWRAAEALADAPVPETIAALRSQVCDASAMPDEHELQVEMIDGLTELAALAATRELPVVETQHRVIGADRCHFLSPVSIAGSDASGKLFLTDQRMIFASGGAPSAWPWHRVRAVDREGRDLLIVLTSVDTIIVRCNSLGDALVARYVALRASQLVSHAHTRAARI